MDTKWVETVRKLMDKAENFATTEHERELLNEKIAYLMAKYSIEDAMLKAKEGKVLPPITISYVVKNPYRARRQMLLNSLALAFGCTTVRLNDGVMQMFGYEDDLTKVYMLYNSILVQMETGLATAVAREKPSHVHGKTFNTSWITGFMLAVIQKVKDVMVQAKHEAREEFVGTDIVLRDRKLAVIEEMTKVFPRLKMTAHSSTVNYGAAYASGKAAGQRADVGQQRVSGGRKGIGA